MKGAPRAEKVGAKQRAMGAFGFLTRIILFAAQVIMCTVVCLSAFGGRAPFDLAKYLSIGIAVLLVVTAAVRFRVANFRTKIALFVIDSFVLVLFSFFSGVSFIYVLYAIVLSDFYISSPGLRDSVIYFGVNLGAYTVWYIVAAALGKRLESAFYITSEYFVALIVLFLHFSICNFAMTVWRKNKVIESNLAELEKSREELMHAYDRLEEATVLEERNRIAKDIHDTAGHSLTTVIMQTEVARLNIEKDPEEAKRCIIAANIQAKNCLEQLRASVHLLSGKRAGTTFKQFLENILEETSNGTYLTMRSKIDDIELTAEAERFVANTLREGIANGIRHGGSTAFFFELLDRGNYVEFLLSDNGSGVDMNEFREGFGLSGMHAKADALGAMMRLSSEPGEGFEIRLSLPACCKVQRTNGGTE